MYLILGITEIILPLLCCYATYIHIYWASSGSPYYIITLLQYERVSNPSLITLLRYENVTNPSLIMLYAVTVWAYNESFTYYIITLLR